MPAYVDIATAAETLSGACRIVVIGCSGGGKSTLAQKIAAHFKLKYVSFDRDVIWLPGWKERPPGERRALIAAAVEAERWITDGTSTSSFDLRLPRADLVVWARMPRWLCLWGVISRRFKYAGRSRPDMAAGCPERLEWQFLQYIWTFESVQTPRIIAGLDKHGPDVPVFVVKSRNDARKLLDLAGAPA